jgi:hypothetical protein
MFSFDDKLLFEVGDGVIGSLNEDEYLWVSLNVSLSFRIFSSKLLL